MRAGAALVTLLLPFAGARPLISSQITWLYSNSLDAGARFARDVCGFEEVVGLQQASMCRIFAAAPAQYLGVCDTRPAATCPNGPEGELAPPVTFTLVVATRDDVDTWRAFVQPAVDGAEANATAPSASEAFAA